MIQTALANLTPRTKLVINWSRYNTWDEIDFNIQLQLPTFLYIMMYTIQPEPIGDFLESYALLLLLCQMLYLGMQFVKLSCGVLGCFKDRCYLYRSF